MANGGKTCFILIIFEISLAFSDVQHTEHQLRIGETVLAPKSYEKRLEVFCYPPQRKHILHLWRTVWLNINIPPEKYQYYVGSTPEEVIAQYESDQSFWKISIFSWKNEKITLHPFNGTCLGIYTDADYQAKLNIIWVDFWKVLMLAGGIVLFFLSPKLSQNVLFYYVCGIALGLCGSFILIIMLFSKLLPRRPAMVAFLVGGWTASAYLLQLIWSNMQMIMTQYYSYLMSYVALTSVISFMICYRFGPLTDPRSKTLLKWFLQAVSLLVIFFSSDFHDATTAIIIILITFYNFPSSWSNAIKAFWRKKFPPKIELLSESEYIEEGVIETKKALTELRKHCSSPECNAWKTVLRLKDPLRFASFIEGTSHISDDEIMGYERDTEIFQTELLTDDASSESE